jgi:O-antigen/teichoic acid export membrane protein
MFSTLKRLYDKALLDKSIVYTILTRLIQSIGGIIALLLVTFFLGKNEQGYYYTFSSIISIQIFFELGLTTIITQYIAHEVAHLTWKNNTELSGDDYYKSRIASIIRLSVKWFAVLSVTMFFVLQLAGFLFFSRFNKQLNIQWQLPWLILTIATSLLLIINLFLAIIEGLGKIKEVTQLRLIQQAVVIILTCIFLAANLNLLSGGLALLISSITIGIILFSTHYSRIIKKIWQTEIKWKVDYKKEVLPFQWRIGLGHISGYLIYQLLNPVLFATQGPVLAGQMGATQTFLNGILVVSLSWFSTKVALFSNLVSLKDYNKLNRIYKKNLLVSVLVCVVGLLMFTFIIMLLKQYYPRLGNRFLPIIPIVFLGLTQLKSVINNGQAYYLRSFKKEPFFITSIVIGLVSGAATVFSSKYYGIITVTAVYFIINGIVDFAWCSAIFRNKSYEWTKIKNWI